MGGRSPRRFFSKELCRHSFGALGKSSSFARLAFESTKASLEAWLKGELQALMKDKQKTWLED